MARAFPTIISVLIITTIFVVFGQWRLANKVSENIEIEEVEEVEEIAPVPNAPLIQLDRSYSTTESVTESGLWIEIAEIPAAAPAIRSDVPDKRLIKLNRELISGLSVGREVDVSIPHLNSTIRVSIGTVAKLTSGNTSILGKVDGNPLLDFVMTVSEKSTFATIGTEQGVFSLRGDETLAWIAPARAFNHHVDPTVPDFRIPKPPVAQAAPNPG